MTGLLLLIIVFIPHSFPLAGAESWSLLDLLLLPTIVFYVVRGILSGKLYLDLRFSSVLPLIFLFLVSLHIVTDPRLEEIVHAFMSYRLPVGGFRIYYSTAILVLLYYLVPLVINRFEYFQIFLRLYLCIIVAQILLCFSRMMLGIERLPWDTYGSQVSGFSESSMFHGAVRFIFLGELGLLLLIYAMAFGEIGQKRWKILSVLAVISLIVSSGRGTLFAAFLAFCVMLGFEQKKWFITLSLCFAVILGLLVFAFHPQFFQKLPPTARRYASVLSGQNPSFHTDEFDRREMWRIQLHALLRHPFWGSVEDFPKDSEERSEHAVMRGDTHGIYLGIASRYGIPVFLVWLVFVYRQVRRAWLMLKCSTQNNYLHSISLWLLLGIAGYLVVSLTGGSADGGFRGSFVCFGLVDVLYRFWSTQEIVKEKEKDSHLNESVELCKRRVVWK